MFFSVHSCGASSPQTLRDNTSEGFFKIPQTQTFIFPVTLLPCKHLTLILEPNNQNYLTYLIF